MRRGTALLLVAAVGVACGDAEGGAETGAVRTLEPGDQAPNFSLPTADGGQITLADLKGRPALFYFSMGPG